MKITIALHSCMDMGGIINHTEQLIGGLRDLGHSVRLMDVAYHSRPTSQSRNTTNSEFGPSGIRHDQGKGWVFDKNDRLGYKTYAGMDAAKEWLNSQDIVIWTVPVPPKNKSHLGNGTWPELYDLNPNVRQIAFIHDGNAKGGAPHLLHIQEHLDGVACVHACALNGSSHLTVPRKMILNPQFNPVRKVVPWSEKKKGFFNMQTFKAWKHAHELVAAIRYMKPKQEGELRDIAGKGIEYQYLTSIDKCKPDYFHADGERYWDAALENGMVHHDYLNNAEVDKILCEARVLVDPSWSKKYSKIGGHWNRVVVDAMIRGCVPVASSLGMGDELFHAGEHFIDLESSGLTEYWEHIENASNMSEQDYNRFREAALEVLPMFNRVKIAREVIALAFQEADDTIIGKEDNSVRAKSDEILFNHYGILA
jgi:hypothetical protein